MAGLTRRVVFITGGLALMVVLHLAVVIWALFRARPSRRVAEAEHAEEEGGGAGLASEEVGELPCHEFKEERAGGGGGECVVCLEAILAGARCRVLPRCGHGFHAECVDSWLRRSRRCPVCRTEAVERRKDAGVVAEAAAAAEIVTESGR
ncbi:hypothetical protein SETIT_1G306900v2 [Setaria italica]|uniref:RING-type domain-containing protein n=1 Tax=Setaria italica TaxID=4555 RepID=K3YXT7_SETIT|nr:E3 ubiquitin-protein ligase EL5 [Setaria italica]RCV08195.1 hypothetical protein SETIT_1G306900v2 [Setaria italica]